MLSIPSYIMTKAGGMRKGPCRACVSHGEAYIQEDGKALCGTCWRWKVVCGLSEWKPHRVKVKHKGGSVINSDEDMEGEPELKWRKVDPELIMEIWQPVGTSLSLFWDLISMLQEHVMEQQKQTTLLEWIAHVQELDHADWV